FGHLADLRQRGGALARQRLRDPLLPSPALPGPERAEGDPWRHHRPGRLDRPGDLLSPPLRDRAERRAQRSFALCPHGFGLAVIFRRGLSFRGLTLFSVMLCNRHMRRCGMGLGLACVAFALPAWAGPGLVRTVRCATTDQSARVVIDVSRPLSYGVSLSDD